LQIVFDVLNISPFTALPTPTWGAQGYPTPGYPGVAPLGGNPDSLPPDISGYLGVSTNHSWGVTSDPLPFPVYPGVAMGSEQAADQ